jgi:hypothetical protein
VSSRGDAEYFAGLAGGPKNADDLAEAVGQGLAAVAYAVLELARAVEAQNR